MLLVHGPDFENHQSRQCLAHSELLIRLLCEHTSLHGRICYFLWNGSFIFTVSFIYIYWTGNLLQFFVTGGPQVLSPKMMYQLHWFVSQ